MKRYIDQQDARIKMISSGHENWYLPNSGIWNERYMSEMKDVLTNDRKVKELNIIIGNLPKRCYTILDAPCGYGRISNALAERKYKVTGIDLNRYFIKIAQEDAKERGVSVTHHVGNILSKKINNKFDAVINIFTSLGYLETEKKNDEFLARLCGYVKPGGRLLIETINPLALLNNDTEESIKIVDDNTTLLFQHHYDVITSTNTTRVQEIQSKRTVFSGVHITRMYYPHELVQKCEQYGCRIKRILDYKGHERDIKDSPRMWLIFTKK